MILKLVYLALLMCAANFLYQSFWDIPKWGEAAERTFFQWAALAQAYVFVLKPYNRDI